MIIHDPNNLKQYSIIEFIEKVLPYYLSNKIDNLYDFIIIDGIKISYDYLGKVLK